MNPVPRVLAAREYREVVATTDVHSSLDRIDSLAGSLGRLRAAGALTADCGDFFEGTGYYILGHGRAEEALLCGLYDIAAPGNHGYRHHHTDPRLRAITVCANVTGQSGMPLWTPLAIASVQGRRTAITAVLGTEAFSSIPLADRPGHQVQDPAAALNALYQMHHTEADSWVVLSHSGFGHDVQLARSCRFTDVIFAGHCHSPCYGPQAAGNTVVVKGAELAAGYAAAWPEADGRWHADVRAFTAGTASGLAGLPEGIAAALTSAARLHADLHREIGPVHARFAGRTPPRDELLGGVCAAAMDAAGANAAMVNVTCLRETRLDELLTAGDLMSVAPFGNRLITVITPDAGGAAARLEADAGPLIAVPVPLPGMARLVTTDYLAATYLTDGPERRAGDRFSLPLRDLVADVLLGRTDGPDRGWS